ncbi:hypothetical protein M5689_011702 [Euphorbia peplus]|nr:hypothetical protein M5689_011702 [Euphorbia peplus]
MRIVMFVVFIFLTFCLFSSFYIGEASFAPQEKPLNKSLKLGGVHDHKVEIHNFQKHGKGYGGGDLLRPRNGHKNGAPPFALKSSSILSTLLREREQNCSNNDHMKRRHNTRKS